jgi:hypothetical protein
MNDQPGEPTEEELRAALEAQLSQLRVEDVLLQTVITLVNLAGRRLTVEEEKDPDQARLGIEAVRALLPLVPLPPEELGPIRDALSQLQMIYVREAQGEGAAAPGGQAPPPGPGGPGAAGGSAVPAGPGGPAGQPGPVPPPGRSPEEIEREKARAKIWTPPGA